jgi:hypothetical protein
MSDVKIVIDASTNNIESAINNVAVSLNKLESEARQTNEALKESSDSLSAKWRDASVSLASTFSLIRSGFDKLQAGFSSLREGADLSEAKSNFRAFAASVGADADTVIAAVRKATKNQVSDSAIMQSATRALRLGITSDLGQLARLYEIADTKGDMFGQSLEETFRQITDAIAKGNGKALIELGVLPESFGKAGSAAELLQKKASLLNTVLRESEQDMRALAPVGDTLSDKFNQMEAGIGNVADQLKMSAADVFAPTVEWLNTDLIPALKSSIDYWREWAGLLNSSRELYASFGPAGQLAAKMDDMAKLKGEIKGLIELRANLENQKMNDDGSGMLSGIAEVKLGSVRSDLENKKLELKSIEKEYQQLLDSIKKNLNSDPPPSKPPTGGGNSDSLAGSISGEARKAEEALKAMRAEAEKAQKTLFDLSLANFKKELAVISDLKDPLVKYFEAAELAEKTTLSLAAAVGTVTGGGATSLYQALNGVKDAAFNAEESMFDLFQRTKQEAEEAAKTVEEVKKAYEAVQKSNVMLWNNTTGTEASMAAANWISGGLLTAQAGSSSSTKDAIKDIKEPLSKTIAEAVQAGFANADFSNLSRTLGDILSSVLTRSVAQSNPIMNAAGSINFGNLGLNLAASAVSSVLTRSGRFFGGREEHGKEAIGQVTDLINNLTKAYDQSYLSEIYSVYAPQDRKNAIEAARKKARGASASYTWSDSGNGVWSDKTRTYALVDNGAGDALRAIQEAVKAVETISKNKELDLKLEAAQGFEYKVLKEQVAAYQTSLQSLYYGPSSYSDSATDRTEATRTVQTELAQMIRELASATAERSTNISTSYAQYAPWLTMTGTRDQTYENWQSLQTSYFDRDINAGMLDIVKSSGKSKYDLQALQISDPEAYKEEYQDYLDRQMEAYEEVMERQAAIFDDLTKSYEERSAALQAFEDAQEGYYQAKLDAMAAEQAAEEAIKQKQQEADLRKAERMEAALSLVGEVAQRGDKIVILQGGDSTVALKELLEKFSDDPEVSAILQAAITNSEAKARWGN